MRLLLWVIWDSACSYIIKHISVLFIKGTGMATTKTLRRKELWHIGRMDHSGHRGMWHRLWVIIITYVIFWLDIQPDSIFQPLFTPICGHMNEFWPMECKYFHDWSIKHSNSSLSSFIYVLAEKEPIDNFKSLKDFEPQNGWHHTSECIEWWLQLRILGWSFQY